MGAGRLCVSSQLLRVRIAQECLSKVLQQHVFFASPPQARLRRVRQFAANGGATCDMQTLRFRLSG